MHEELKGDHCGGNTEYRGPVAMNEVRRFPVCTIPPSYRLNKRMLPTIIRDLQKC